MLRTLHAVDWPDAPPALEVSVVIPMRGGSAQIAPMLSDLEAALVVETRGSFEVVVVVNGHPEEARASESVLRALSARHPFLRVASLSTEVGKGAAVRWGVRGAGGKALVLTDADQPFAATDIVSVLRAVRAGDDFVIANRGLLESSFRVPVSLLHLAYGRHRAGQAFNALVRATLGLQTLDTQAGLKGFSRRFARAAFQRITCPGFLFDIELFLVARALGLPVRELPVETILRSEASTVRVLRDAAVGTAWLSKIALNDRLGRYAVDAFDEAASARA
jgi:hypothetical protein